MTSKSFCQRAFWRRKEIVGKCIRNISVSSHQNYAQLPRIKVDMSESVSKTFGEEDFVPKKHPGVLFRGRVCLPSEFTQTAKKILGNNSMKVKTKEMIEFEKHLKGRDLPIEPRAYKEMCIKIEERVRSKEEVMEPFFNAEQLQDLENRRFRETRELVKRLVYHWEPENYSGRKVLEYLMLRSDAEYAALYKIMSEISKRDPDFEPVSLLDFGSGLCTSTWAANAFWNKSLNEHLCVDTSSDMNDTAELILRQGKRDKPTIFRNVFFRQFLPTSPTRQYDLVTSAYSLFELPSAKARIEVLNTLWRKCAKYLIIVEYGRYPGFRLINEARDFVLRLDRPTYRGADGHAFSPCPHDAVCPRFHEDIHACKFSVDYRSMIPFDKQIFKQELFSYVVLKKGTRSPKEPDWPRLLEEPIVRKRHIICRLCLPSGNLKETVVTKKGVSQPMYRATRKSQWGDMLPVEEIELTNSSDSTEGVDVEETEQDPKL
ncbi:unnamed protein product [Allacma fusca]|uniref:Methyltransferase-like protein 17, mitochondrial n=1 Tax=Allacma fusca TaxID=39272 RepID=A0A8J2JNF7_9HEXA|nr:unnamed protein product [Allacma fusca]